MNQAIASEWRGPRGRKRLAVLGGSVALHTVILALIGLGLVETRRLLPDETLPIQLQLEPRPLLPGEVARRPTRAAASSNQPQLQAQTQSQAQTPAQAQPSALPRDEATNSPSPPMPRIAAPQPSGLTGAIAPGTTGAPTTDDRWTVRTPDMSGSVARSLRLGPAGCRALDGQLPEGEQRVCDDAFNAAAGRARPIGPRTLNASETRRQEQFAREGAAAIARYERRRAPMRAGVGVAGAAPECPGGNLRGTCPGANLPSHYQHGEENPFGGSAGPK